MPEPLIQIATTASSKDECLNIGRHLVNAGLVACAQVSGPIQSLYHWQGKLCEETEYQLTLKTQPSLFETIEKEILRLHSYDLPQILAIQLTHSNPAYHHWVLNNTQAPKHP